MKTKNVVIIFIGSLVAISIGGYFFQTNGQTGLKGQLRYADCIDTDEGASFFTQGRVKASNATPPIADYCTTINKKEYLMEGICKNNKYIWQQKNCKELGSYLCNDGACVTDDIGQFLDDPIIGSAIGNLSIEDTATLKTLYAELQKNNTSTWSEFDNKTDFTLAEIKKIWLRRVAYALYVEKQKLVPWSLKQFSADQLKSMLSFCNEKGDHSNHIEWKCELYIVPFGVNNGVDNYEFENDTIIAPNPITEFAIAQKLLNPSKINDTSVYDQVTKISKPKDLIDKLISGLRKIGLNHLGSATPAKYQNDKIVALQDFYQQTIDHPDQPIGTSHRNAVFLSDLLRSWNVPSLYVRNNKIWGHGSILFVTENIGMMSADDIQALASWPIDAAYRQISDLKIFFYSEECQGEAFVQKLFYDKLLNYYNDPIFFTKIYYKGINQSENNAYCVNQDFLSNINLAESVHCGETAKNTNPALYAGPSVKIYTEQEIKKWTDQLSEYEKNKNICGGLDSMTVPPEVSTTLNLNFPSPVASVDPSLVCKDNVNIDGNGGTVYYKIPASNKKINEYILNLDDAAKQVAKFFSTNTTTCQKTVIAAQLYNSSGKNIGASYSPTFTLTITPPQKKCIDSDASSAAPEFTFGNATQYDGDGQKINGYDDQCTDANTLMEAYCYAENGPTSFAGINPIQCKNGCKDGICNK